MANLNSYIYKDPHSHFYLDLENYNESDLNLTLDYEDGDMIKWTWEGKKMTGILREEGLNLGLFKIEGVECFD